MSCLVTTEQSVAHFKKRLRQNDIRTDKVAEIRAQIEAGTYETEEKIDGAIERLDLDMRWQLVKRS